MTGENNIATPATRQRLTSLDAVRGIASFIVILTHCYLTIPDLQRAQFDGLLWSKLLRPFHNGAAAVTIFFVLSGYVLALPYLGGTPLSYPRFVIRRVCRIYIPFAASILFALLLYGLANHHEVTDAGAWLNTRWISMPSPAATLAGHFLMLGTRQDMMLNAIMWTLVYEMRISLLFPLLIILCRDTRLAVIVALVLLEASTKALATWAHTSHPADAENFRITLLWTIQMIPYFITGILLCKHREQIHVLWERMPNPVRFGLLAAPVAIFMISHDYRIAKLDALYDLGAAILVVLAIEGQKLRAFLNTPIPQWLGRISYSVYLIHLPIMLVVVPMLVGRVPFVVVVLAAISTSLGAATVMHVLVEAPAIRLGQRFAPSRSRVTRIGE